MKDEPLKADNLFQNLTREYPNDVEVGLENVKFLAVMIKRKLPLKRSLSPEIEVQKLLDLLESGEASGNLWAASLIECSKVLELLATKTNELELKLKAIECLLKIKQVLPVIDTKLAAVKVPGSLGRYLFEEFDHIDFQATSQTSK